MSSNKEREIKREYDIHLIKTRSCTIDQGRLLEILQAWKTQGCKTTMKNLSLWYCNSSDYHQFPFEILSSLTIEEHLISQSYFNFTPRKWGRLSRIILNFSVSPVSTMNIAQLQSIFTELSCASSALEELEIHLSSLTPDPSGWGFFGFQAPRCLDLELHSTNFPKLRKLILRVVVSIPIPPTTGNDEWCWLRLLSWPATFQELHYSRAFGLLSEVTQQQLKLQGVTVTVLK